jgi:hypothetical protein
MEADAMKTLIRLLDEALLYPVSRVSRPRFRTNACLIFATLLTVI